MYDPRRINLYTMKEIKYHLTLCPCCDDSTLVESTVDKTSYVFCKGCIKEMTGHFKGAK